MAGAIACLSEEIRRWTFLRRAVNRRATFRLVWYAGQVTFQCEKHASVAQRIAVRAGLPLLLTNLD